MTSFGPTTQEQFEKVKRYVTRYSIEVALHLPQEERSSALQFLLDDAIKRGRWRRVHVIAEHLGIDPYDSESAALDRDSLRADLISQAADIHDGTKNLNEKVAGLKVIWSRMLDEGFVDDSADDLGNLGG